jgi:hypothetical protein
MWQPSTESYHSVIESIIENFKGRINCDIIEHISDNVGTYHDVSTEILNRETKNLLFNFYVEYDYVGGLKIKECIDKFEVDFENKILKFSDPEDRIYHEHCIKYMNNRYTDLTNFKVEIKNDLKEIESAILGVYDIYTSEMSMINSMDLAKEEESVITKETEIFKIWLQPHCLNMRALNNKLEDKKKENFKIKTEYESNEDFQKFKKNKI